MCLFLNRYERKKNIALAIDSLEYLKNSYKTEEFSVLLVVAGGYDVSVTENRCAYVFIFICKSVCVHVYL
jgi:glycosyltransferase involved in cell wall biosynthesis